MDFQYNFRQAQVDRLEDAGVKRYGYQNTDGYVLENENDNEQPGRQPVMKQVKRALLATVHLLVK